MISAVSWVPKGVSKPVPSVADPPSKEEIEELMKTGVLNQTGVDEEEEEEEGGEEGGMEVEPEPKTANQTSEGVAQAFAAAAALGKAPKSSSNFVDIADTLKELDMDNYDNEDDDGIELFSKGLGDLYYLINEMDPYLEDSNGGEDDSEEEEDMMIRPSDGVVVCACNEDEFSHLEVWIYEESEDGSSNVYVHHDIFLSEFPLCTEWLDCPLKGGEKGNFIAVGTMGPSIEIWNLDIIDAVQPSVVLGGTIEKKKNKKGKTSIKYKEDSHTDSVLGLAWNKQYRNALANASADRQVKIWDVATGKCNITMEHHTDKVQAVAWNHHEPQVLLSGSFDHLIVMKDGREPSHAGFKWSVGADVEGLSWNPHNSRLFVVSLEDGTLQGFHIRGAAGSTKNAIPSFTLHAHDKAVCSISYNPSVPNELSAASSNWIN